MMGGLAAAAAAGWPQFEQILLNAAKSVQTGLTSVKIFFESRLIIFLFDRPLLPQIQILLLLYFLIFGKTKMIKINYGNKIII